MFRLKDSIHVNAPVDRCFLLATSIELVAQTLEMRPVEGKTAGLIVGGDQLVWRGWKFGLPAMHETLITGYDRPNFFQDTMGRGYFKRFQHDHHFEAVDGHTLMVDVVRFSMRFGPAGRLVGKYVVVPHVMKLLVGRFQLLKRIAEGPDWERYVVSAGEPKDRAAAALDAAQQV
jgi:ligand-binding SRPBCC domain-containing protein